MRDVLTRGSARLLTATMLSLVMLAVPHSAVAAGPAPGIQYVQQVDAALTAIDVGDIPGALRDLESARVLTPDPTAVDVIITALRARPPDTAQARARLRAITAIDLPIGAVANTNDNRARQLLHDVYQRPEFRDLTQPADNVFISTLRRFGGWLADNTVGRAGRTLSLAIAAVALALIVLLALRRLMASSAERTVHALSEDAERGDDPDVEWSLAEAAAASGDHREAVRRAFRSALLAIALRGRLPVSAAWTTRELLANARGDADLIAALAPAAALFDRVWYSGRDAGDGDWETMRERCERIRALARSGAVGVAQ